MGAVIFLSYANNPKDPELDNLRGEKQAVGSVLRPWALKNGVFLDIDDNTEIDGVFSRLEDNEYAQNLVVFGFSGHSGGGRLIFNDTDARGQGLAELMCTKNCPRLKVVFLNGCVTYEHIKYFEEIDIPIIITTNAPVKDESAMTFSSALFKKLAQGVPIFDAYLYACGKIKTQEQTRVRYRCYREAGKFEYPENIPVWEFAYREERFKNWTLKMGFNEPPKRTTLQGSPSKATRLLFFGEKYFQGIYDQLLDKIEGKSLALACLSMDSIFFQKSSVEKEIENSDAVVFHLQKSQTDKIFRSPTCSWLPNLLVSRRLPVTFLNEDCSPDDIGIYQGMFSSQNIGEYSDYDLDFCEEFLSYHSPTVIPEITLGFSLNEIAHKPSNLINHICAILKKDVVRKVKSHKKFILQCIEEFDLHEQREHFNKISEARKLNFFVIEGTVKCGLELLLKKILRHFSIKRDYCYRIKFNSNEGIIDSEEKLCARLYAKFTESKEKPTSIKKVATRLEMKLEESPICLIFDDPLTLNENNLIIKFWKTLFKSINGQEDLNRFYFIVINKALDTKGHLFLNDYKDEVVVPERFPPISKIKEEHFINWWRHVGPCIRLLNNPINLGSKTDQILLDPYLGSVLEQLCIHLKYPDLFDEILPKYS